MSEAGPPDPHGPALSGPGFAVALRAPGRAGPAHPPGAADPADDAAGAIGAVGFADAPRPHGLDPRAPFLSLPLPLAAGSGPAPVELWFGDGPVRFERAEAIASARAGGALFGVLDEADLPAGIRADGMEAVAREAYARLFALLSRHPGLSLVRAHNYLPRILAVERGAERYRAFNTGRLAAFERHWRDASPDARAASAPAATGVGVPDDRFRLSFLATARPGIPVENPRQVSAWAYPREYGPTSPTFSRATLIAPAGGDGGPALLLVSGTASIVGHETRHAGDAAAQAGEVARNLDALVARAEAATGRRAGRARLRAYLARDGDAALALPALAAWRGSAAPVPALRAALCRPDLLVEAEGIVELA